MGCDIATGRLRIDGPPRSDGTKAASTVRGMPQTVSFGGMAGALLFGNVSPHPAKATIPGKEAERGAGEGFLGSLSCRTILVEQRRTGLCVSYPRPSIRLMCSRGGQAIRCPRCQAENRDDRRFCGEASPLPFGTHRRSFCFTLIRTLSCPSYFRIGARPRT